MKFRSKISTFTSAHAIASAMRLILVLVFCHPIWLLCQPLLKDSPDHIQFLKLDVDLAGEQVHAIEQDRDGFIWFGTTQGLNRYDGENLRTFITSTHPGLPSNSIYNLLATQNKLWVGTEEGICYLSDKDLYKSVKQILWEVGLPNPGSFEVNSIIEVDEQTILLGTSEGLLRIIDSQNPSIDKVQFLGIEIFELAYFGDRLWIGHEEGISVYSLKRVFESDSSLTLQNEFSDFNYKVSKFLIDIQAKRILIGTEEGIEGEGYLLVYSTKNDSLLCKKRFQYPISFISRVGEEQIWLGTHEGGILLLTDDLEIRDPNLFWMKHDYLQDPHVDFFKQSRDRVIWIGTHSGVYYYPSKTQFLNTYFFSDSTNSQITSLIEDTDSTILLGLEENGLWEFNKYSGELTRPPFSLGTSKKPLIKNNTVFDIVKNKGGDLYFAVNGIDTAAIYRRGVKDGNYIAILEEFWQSDEILSLCLSKDEKFILVGTRKNGLNILLEKRQDKKRGILRIPLILNQNKELKDENYRVNYILQDRVDNKLFWIGTEKYGLLYLNIIDMTLTQPRINISSINISSLFQDGKYPKQLWIGTRNDGLVLANISNIDDILCKRLGDNIQRVHAITSEQGSENIWIAHDRFIASIERQDSSHFRRVFDEELNKSIFSTLNIPAIFSTSSRRIYLGGRGSLTSINPSKIYLDSIIQNKLKISDITIFGNDKLSTVVESEINENLTLEMHWRESALIEFSELNFSSFRNHKYSTDFAPKEKFGWSDSSMNTNQLDLKLPRQAYFLGPNEFPLTIKSYGLSSRNPRAELKIQIRAISPFWLKEWVLFLAIPILLIVAYYVSFQRYTKHQIKLNQKLEKTNEELETLVKEQTINLVERNVELEGLHTLINSISRLNNTQEVCESALKDMIEFFGFDFGSVALVDFLHRKIELRYTDVNPNLKDRVDPRAWYKEAKYDLNDNDILSQVVQDEKVYFLDGPKVRKDKEKEWVEIQRDSDLLNWKIFDKYNHKDLFRIYIPFIRRAKELRKLASELKGGEEGDYPIGVFEIGWHRDNLKEITPQKLIDLKLYVDNCAQPYYRAFQNERSERLDSLINEHNSINDPDKYLRALLKSLINEVGGTFGGDMIFLPLNKGNEWEPILKVWEGVDPEEFMDIYRLNQNAIISEKREGIFKHVVKHTKYYFSEDEDDNIFIPGQTNVVSQLSNPIIYRGNVVGVSSLYSNQKGNYDDIKGAFVDRFIERFSENYHKKKVNFFQSKLDNLRAYSPQSKRPHSNTLMMVEDYFHTSHVGIWELLIDADNSNMEEKGGTKYKIQESSEDLAKKLEKEQLTTFEIPFHIKESEEIEIFYLDKLEEINPSLSAFCLKHRFNSVIFIPYSISGNVIGFVTILHGKTDGNQKLVEQNEESLVVENSPKLFAEDKIFLQQVANKIVMTNQLGKLQNTFFDIPQMCIKEDIDFVLQKITKYAVDVLFSNPVFLYRYDSKYKQIFGSVKYSGTIFYLKDEFDNHDPDNVQRSHLAYRVIENGSRYISSKKELLRAYGSHPKTSKLFRQRFWEREKIQACAALRLESKSGVIGVMFFNYRYSNRFTQEAKLLIEAFAAQATFAIEFAENVEQIRQQQQQLEELQSQLEEKNKKLAAAFDQKDREFGELLVSSASISFFKIMYGISHDLRNLLLRMKQSIMEIDKHKKRLLVKDKKIVERRIIDLEKGIAITSKLLDTFDFSDLDDLDNIEEESINVNDVITSAVEFYELYRTDDIYFDISNVSKKGLFVYGVPVYLSMVIFNLLGNSISAIRKSRKENGKIRVSSNITDGSLCIEVEDNGTGIPEKNLERIFEYKFSTDEEGKGIGLYFVKRTIEDNFFGTIEVVSKFGEWTKFLIKIPY